MVAYLRKVTLTLGGLLRYDCLFMAVLENKFNSFFFIIIVFLIKS
jgi:hypothetical protein